MNDLNIDWGNCFVKLSGHEVQLDLDELWRLFKYRYSRNGNKYGNYFSRNVWENGKHTSVLLHREIMDTPKGMVCDHINHNTLDIRKRNLRNCTQAENNMNIGIKTNNTSGFKGVSYHKARKKWQARIGLKGEIYLGIFSKKEDACRAYYQAAKKYHGEFAMLDQIGKE